jgi:uncharacterized protein (TIGR02444 family)
MTCDLWSFSLDVYSRPGVQEACLSLQASGANVCTLLCGAWLGCRGVRCDESRVLEIGQLADPWHDNVVRPLRELRVQWRDASQVDTPLATLRERLKALELDAERELLGRLERLTAGWPKEDAQQVSLWLQKLAGPAAEQNRDALQVLRVAASQSS